MRATSIFTMSVILVFFKNSRKNTQVPKPCSDWLRFFVAFLKGYK